MTKYNASTQETWRFFYARQSWKLIYDPEFVSAKKRTQKQLKILDDPAELEVKLEVNYVIDEEQDAWQCVKQRLDEFKTTFEPDEMFMDQREAELRTAIRRGIVPLHRLSLIHI